MVKASLTGKRPQTTTIAFGRTHAAWVLKAGCGVMVRWNNGLHGAIPVIHHTGIVMLEIDGTMIVPLSECRIYRATVTQIRNILAHE